MQNIGKTGYKFAIFVVMCCLVLAVNGTPIAQDAQTDDRAEAEQASPVALNPAAGSEIGAVYEAFLSPHQEGGEEEDTPAFVPAQFRSTAPSVPRTERTSRGHAVLQFTKDLSKATVFLAVENVNPEDVVLLHLHCGLPGQLGPIIIDFALAGNITSYLADGMLTLELTNADIVAAASHGHGPVDGFTSGCPIANIPTDKVKTIAGMQVIAGEGDLYFNLHTKGQTYFGDIRGQFSPMVVSN
ncbi:MAG: CHRD domain-containing protein [Armatimonadetes bacterium]|nr:CHRD domain-containing protein [Anaerolineae bacterium]